MKASTVTSAHADALLIMEKRIRKLVSIWTKFRSTPPSIISLVRDLAILLNAVQNASVLSQPGRSCMVIAIAVEEYNQDLQHTLDMSSKHTSKFGRKALSTEILGKLEVILTDCKIKALVLQLIIERRDPSRSHTSIAEELAHLHASMIPRISLDKSRSNGLESKTDSLLSFKCYSEIVGREEILLRIDAEYETSNTVLLVGPSGIGKTQIAAEHATRFKNRENNSHVLWIDCESPTTLETSLRSIAAELHLAGAGDYRADVVDRTRRHLNESRTGKWLMILTNITSNTLTWETSLGMSTLPASHFPLNILSCLPEASNGHMLCLTSDVEMVNCLSGNPATINLPPLSKDEAAQLFCSKIPQMIKSPGGGRYLADALKNCPLAVCQAAAYMVATRYNADRYLLLLKTEFPRQFQKTQLQKETQPETAVACLRTTSIAVKRVQKQNPQAADLLYFMSVCNRRVLPKILLWHAWQHGLSDLSTQPTLPELEVTGRMLSSNKILESDRLDYIEFTQAMATLEAYLLIQYNALTDTYSIHQMVQSTVRLILERQETISTWRSSAMVLLAAHTHVFRQPTKHKAETLANLMLHISEVALYQQTSLDAGLAKAKALCDIASFKMFLMQPKDSTPLLREAFAMQAALLKPSDTRTLRTLLALAESTTYSDSPASAIPLFKQAVAGFKQTLGPGNRRTLTAQLNLCSSHIVNGDVKAAAAIHYEIQAAISASLQISADDRRRIEQKLVDVRSQITTSQQRQNKTSKTKSRSYFADELKKARTTTYRLDRKRLTVRGLSASSRIASLDSIVEMYEVEASP